MEEPEKIDRQELLASYGYSGKIGVIRLYFRQMYSLVLGTLAKIAPPPGLRVKLQKARGVKIGKHVYLGFGVQIDDLYSHLVEIEDNATIGMHTMIFTHSNPGWSTEIKENYYPRKVAPVIIRKGAWVGVGCIILAGIAIGENSVVGAGSVVTEDVEPYTVAAGNPAKVVRKLERKASA